MVLRYRHGFLSMCRAFVLLPLLLLYEFPWEILSSCPSDESLSLRDCRFLLRYSGSPVGKISVLPMLNLAPETPHHLSRMFCTVAKLSSFDMYTVVSSANSVVTILSCVVGMLMPLRFKLLSDAANGSIARSKMRQDIASPCWTPLNTVKGELITPLIITTVDASLYSLI